MTSARQTSAVLLALMLSCGACAFPGQKLLELRVTQGGADLLVTSFDVIDSSSKSEIWDGASERPFHTKSVAPLFVRLAGGQTEVQIPGEVEVTITHVHRLETAAKVRDLRFVRTTATADDWRPAAKEIARLKTAAGL